MLSTRLVVAALSAPAAAAAAFYVSWLASLVLFVASFPRKKVAYWDIATKLPETWPLLVYAFVTALVLEISVGLPLLVLFRRMDWLSVQGFLIGGCFVALTFYFVTRGLELPVHVPATLLLLLVPGCVGALVFGYVGGWLTGGSSGPA